MHLLETYALSTGSKIGKPFILKKFFPVGYDKYITVQNSSGMPSKCYDYFQDVIDLLSPILKENGITIVQIGGKDDITLNGVHNLQGATNINQTAYIIDNAMLHLGNDSFAVHMASAFNTPVVGLYSITLPSIAGPYFNKQNSICLYPDDQKPSFDPNETPKRINSIKIEDILKSCLSLLKIAQNNFSINTFYIGKRYKEQMVECIPNSVIHPEFFKNSVLNIRCDYVDTIDLNILYGNISVRQCAIITDKSFDTIPLNNLKQNVHIVIYDITNGLEISFIDSLSKLGVRYICVVDKARISKEAVAEYKLQLIDYCSVDEYSLVPDDCPNQIPDGLECKTNKILISNGNVYTGRACELENIPITDLSNLSINLDLLKDKSQLLKELDHCFLYKK